VPSKYQGSDRRTRADVGYGEVTRSYPMSTYTSTTRVYRRCTDEIPSRVLQNQITGLKETVAKHTNEIDRLQRRLWWKR
jgi:hypothetical protein